MRPGARTDLPITFAREPLRWQLLTGTALLALGLAVLTAGLAQPELGAARSRGEHGACGAQSCVQPRLAAPQEWAAISGSAPTVQLHQHVLAGRGRARLQTDTQSVIRLVRERQAAVITAFTHRLRDASVPGATSHTADRPLIVTRPLRGPPAGA